MWKLKIRTNSCKLSKDSLVAKGQKAAVLEVEYVKGVFANYWSGGFIASRKKNNNKNKLLIYLTTTFWPLAAGLRAKSKAKSISDAIRSGINDL